MRRDDGLRAGERVEETRLTAVGEADEAETFHRSRRLSGAGANAADYGPGVDDGIAVMKPPSGAKPDQVPAPVIVPV